MLVPGVSGCYYAGEYNELLEFEFEGRSITPQAPPGLPTGSVWPGSHVGIPYTLTADGQDVRYVAEPRPNVQKTIRLSEEAATAGTRHLARRLFNAQAGRRAHIHQRSAGILRAYSIRKRDEVDIPGQLGR